MQRHSRKMYTIKEKAEILKAIEESGNNVAKWCRENKVSLSNVHRWVKNPLVKVEMKQTPAVKLVKEVVDLSKIDTIEIKDAYREIAFDDNEHRIIRFACASLRETLESVMYKIAAMDVEKRK